MIMKLNYNYKEMNRIIFAYFNFLIKVIIIIVVSYKTSYCLEIDSVFADKNLTLPTRINFALNMALKKYDGKKIWIVYSLENAYLMNITSRHRMIEQNRVILDYSLESGNPCLYQVFINQMDQLPLLEFRPRFWLREATTGCSINWLKDQFDKTKNVKLKQQIIATIGAHDDSKEVVNFQKQIILGNNSPKLKSEAISWLGKHNSPESIKLLAFLAVKQKNIQLRKKAICALSQIHNRHAQAVVITLALKEKNQQVREEAIFWLSQIADDYALKTLNEILNTEYNPTIKNCAIFAISQLPESKATPLLHRIAQKDPDTQVRKKARFWLNRMKEQRLMEFLNDLCEDENRRGSN